MNGHKTSLLAVSLCCAAAALLAGCEDPPLPPLTVDQLVEDPVMLDGVLMKCNGALGAQRPVTECKNARIAVERIAAEREKVELAQREATFQRSRERLRQQQDLQRRQEEEAKKVDPYKLPVVPPAETGAPPATASN
ncbi:MAG: EexN family lipoprotein [Proteobacteria bacterium]|nr:EexN family lipoprotein [Pseudomonadota bacterium]